MKRLGEILQEHGWVSREQLLRALRNQKVVGGRLGTCLLEIDALSEETLLKALSEQHGLPHATADDLRGIPEEVYHLVPGKLAKRLLAIPYRGSEAQISVAVVDGRNLRIQDELAFITGRRMRPHVACEVRIWEALEKYYGVECPSRAAKLLDRLNRARYLWAKTEAAPRVEEIETTLEVLNWDPHIAGSAAPAGVAAPAAAAASAPPIDPARKATDGAQVKTEVAIPLPVIAPPHVSSEEEPSLIESSREIPLVAASPQGPTAEASGEDTQEVDPGEQPPMPLEEAERRLLNPSTRDDVARALLEYLAGRFARVAVFMLRREEVVPWFWHGAPNPAKIEAYRANLREPSIFLTVRESGTIFRGVLPPMPPHLALHEAWGEADPRVECVVFPVRLRGRLVAVAAAARPLEGPASPPFAELQRLANKAAIAFELCIMRNKLRSA